MQLLSQLYINVAIHLVLFLGIPGQDRYLVLHKGCLYYYKDSTDKSAQGQFSLSGYRYKPLEMEEGG